MEVIDDGSLLHEWMNKNVHGQLLWRKQIIRYGKNIRENNKAKIKTKRNSSFRQLKDFGK